MSHTEKILKKYDIWEARILALWAFVNRKTFKRWSMYTIVTFVLLMSAPTLAQEQGATLNSWQYDGALTYEECYEMQIDQGYDSIDAYLRDGGDTTCHKFATGVLDAVGVVVPAALSGADDSGTGLNSQRRRGVSLEGSGGIMGLMDAANYAILYNPPGVDLVAHMSDQWVPGQDISNNSVYAQESGYDYLTAVNIADLWGVTRMIAYALFVVALIIAGFMIMFRQKIGGQMAVTVFNTIPKVIVGLILVTFSFAIVGFIIDLGILANTIIESILVEGGDPIVVAHPFSLFTVLFRGDNGLGQLTGDLFGAGVVMGLVGVIGFIPGLNFLLAPGLVGGLAMGIVILVIAAIVLFASIKVFITLLKAWVGLIIDTIMGPLFLVIAVIPGRSSVGWSWFWRVVKNVLTFVGVFLLINLAGYLYSHNVNLYFPAGLAGGDSSAVTGVTSGILTWIMNAALPLFLFYMAAEVPNFLSDFLPTDGGKGAATAMGNIQKNITKYMPV